MGNLPSFGPPASEDERQSVVALLAPSFNVPPAKVPAWLKRAGHDNVRVVREDDAPVATLLRLPMGLWLGGRPVPMVGIAAVATAPEHRGRGAGSRIMRSVVEELHRDGVPVSVLYPATQPVYRSAGYEQAGCRFGLELATESIGVKDRTLDMRAAGDSDMPAIHEAYRVHAARWPGHLERSDYMWYRVRNTWERPTRGYVVQREGSVEGYVFLDQPAKGPGSYDLLLTDVVALTPAAGRRLLTFFADHRSLADKVIWHGSPVDPLLQLLPEQTCKVSVWCYWMLRVVNVKAALAARGYPVAIRAQLHLEVRDALIPANEGRFVLDVADGRGEVRAGGEGRLRMDVRGLAPLYTGFRTPEQLAVTGLLEGSEADLRAGAAVFGGAVPAMPDGF